ncbi:26S proteasome subunit Rpn10 [Acrasis kona]|uniref:26S proteasome subunit Rpn10 n=1 Tax=Acrasis kona TaxID=1008807 RepID=A0AAW2ZA51_9EUKA
MVKEQVIICVDNSEHMRNGDYNPTRMIAQQEAANLICGAKTQQNPETTLGILSMAGKSPVVQVALTTDLGKLLSSLSSVQIHASTHFSLSMRVAQLALKRRVSDQGTPNRRIIAFVGSPLKESQDELVELGLRLKKNNIAVDVVNFGEEGVNTSKLDAFINSVVSDDNSHLVTVPPGPHLLSDMLLSSPVVTAGGDLSASGVGVGGGNGGDDFAVDPNMDPELAMALRMSLEDERRRQERVRAEEEAAGGGSGGGATSAAPDTRSETQPLLSSNSMQDDDDDEDEEIRRAIALSLAEEKNDDSMQQDEDLYDDDMDEDELLKAALALSKQESGSTNADNAADQLLDDEEYMKGLLQTLDKQEEKKDDKKNDKKDQ